MKSIYVIALCISLQSQAKVILWDLGGVLCEPDKLGVAMEVGLTGFASHAFWDMRSPTAIQASIFDVIRHLDFDEHERTDVAGSATGLALPPIMCKWQAGTVTGKEIIKRARPVINRLYKYDYFDSKSHKDIIWRCIKTMFDPHILAKNVYVVDETVAMLQESYRLKNKDGTPKHRQFVFSNWDHISFDIFCKQNQWLFRYFEHIVISGHIKRIKPNRNAYQYLIDTYGLDPKECILIDDQEVNCRAARNCGMKAVLIHGRNYTALRNELKALGVI